MSWRYEFPERSNKRSLGEKEGWTEAGFEKATGKTPIFWNSEEGKMKVTLPNGKTIIEKCQKLHHAPTIAMNIAMEEMGKSL